MHTSYSFDLIGHLKKSLNPENGQDSHAGSKVYQSLYDAFKEIIVNGHLLSNTKLPSTRRLAAQLNVSRSTMVKVYNLLILENYILAKKGSGYYVSGHHFFKNDNKSDVDYTTDLSLSARGERILALYKDSFILPYEGLPFRPGLPPLDIFPINIWKKLTNDWWKYVKTTDISFSQPLGAYPLRKIIAENLLPSRGVVCDPEQVIIVSGTTHALMLIARLFLDAGDQVLTENPLYINARNVFMGNGAELTTLEIDEQGIAINKADNSVAPKLVYVTPSNQYPTGVKMTRKRRKELLDWVGRKKAMIIEDDYDWEYSSRQNPINSLYGMDNGRRVIYIGTFNKVLHPAVRLGYMVVPKEFTEAFHALQVMSFRFLPMSRQLILYQFIKKGYFDRHIGNLLNTSRERKNFFVDFFEGGFKSKVDVFCPNDSLNLIVKLPSYMDDKEIVKTLHQKGIIASPYSSYFNDKTDERGLILGYASVDKNKVAPKIKIIIKVLQDAGMD